ncbi:MAG: transcription antitermination factor NusB [Clostridium sp.]|nr:transcription antitermination factor NusB [Clostridium sp.]
MKKRKQTREVALKLLFELSINKKDMEKILEDYLKYKEDDIELDLKYLNEVLIGASSKLDVLDATIERFLVNWKLDRISKIDLAILRLGTYEINYMDNIPNNVSINEALELSERYSEKDSSGFTNGVLDKISKEDKSIIKEIEILVKQRKLEKERLEKERLEKERLEQKRLEEEILEKEILEKERLEEEILEEERLEEESKEEKLEANDEEDEKFISEDDTNKKEDIIIKEETN